jgi:hypothetical protein
MQTRIENPGEGFCQRFCERLNGVVKFFWGEGTLLGFLLHFYKQVL